MNPMAMGIETGGAESAQRDVDIISQCKVPEQILQAAIRVKEDLPEVMPGELIAWQLNF